MSTMTPGERVHAAVRGEPVDRVPLCFWHHFKPSGSGERLAELTLEFFVQKFHLDIVKIMPDLPYPPPNNPIVDAEQMRFLSRLELDTPMFREQLLCIRTLRSHLGADYPLILTLFSPLTYAFNFMGKQKVLAAMRKDSAPIEEGLGTIASNLRRLLEAAVDAGISGVFFSCMGATTADFSREEYSTFCRTYDLMALRGAAGAWLNIVHIHADPGQANDQIYFNAFTDYPASVLSWSDRLTGPSLSEAFSRTDKCLMGGLWERGPLTHGSEMELRNEIMSSLSQTEGRRLILANGCSVPDDTPEQWLHTARHLIDDLA